LAGKRGDSAAMSAGFDKALEAARSGRRYFCSASRLMHAAQKGSLAAADPKLFQRVFLSLSLHSPRDARGEVRAMVRNATNDDLELMTGAAGELGAETRAFACDAIGEALAERGEPEQLLELLALQTEPGALRRRLREVSVALVMAGRGDEAKAVRQLVA
jgi:hypothetical protein